MSLWERMELLAAQGLLLALWALLLWLDPNAWHPLETAVLVVLALLCLLGVHDALQRRHAILRNYPVIGHVRWMAELVRPEIRQYLIESDEDGRAAVTDTPIG